MSAASMTPFGGRECDRLCRPFTPAARHSGPASARTTEKCGALLYDGYRRSRDRGTGITLGLSESCGILASASECYAITRPSISRDMKSSSIRIATRDPPFEGRSGHPGAPLSPAANAPTARTALARRREDMISLFHPHVDGAFAILFTKNGAPVVRLLARLLRRQPDGRPGTAARFCAAAVVAGRLLWRTGGQTVRSRTKHASHGLVPGRLWRVANGRTAARGSVLRTTSPAWPGLTAFRAAIPQR